MLVDFTIGSGPPIVEKPQRLTLDNLPETRAGTKYTFEFLMVAAKLLDHDEFFVLRTAANISPAGEALIWEVSNNLFQRPLLILDNGMTLAGMTNNQIRARMGL